MLFVPALIALCFSTTTCALPSTRDQTKIEWQACPELNKNISLIIGVQAPTFDCAKLSVPLDYTDPNSKPLNLDLFKVNATKEPVLGSVLINFGGPGGTGAENLPALAERMAENIGPQWNLVSWDPRGTGKTIPFDCKFDTASLSSPNKRKRDNYPIASANVTAYFLNGGWDTAELVAEGCYAAMNETGQYIGTPFVARDMMKIVDALGEDGLLRYYGWSYGTALGSYVAAMFPDRVERIVLDANVNPYDYQSGDYGDFLLDADKTFSAFLQECFNNKNDCALAQYAKANKTEDLLTAINLQLQPLAVNASTGNTAWSPYSSIQQLIYKDLYYPAKWPELADTITSLLNGSASSTSSTTSTTNSSIPVYNLGAEWAAIGIRASDALWRTNSSAEYLPQVQYQEKLSSFDSNYPSIWISARWRINAKEQYKGNFSVKTKHPILYVNSEYDPATPLANAYAASKGFEGSAVLPHSGYGHGIVVDPSACVAKYIQAYFQDGTLPPNGTHCQPDQGPWEMAKAAASGTSSGAGSNTTTQPYPGAASHSRTGVLALACTVVLLAVGMNML